MLIHTKEEPDCSGQGTVIYHLTHLILSTTDPLTTSPCTPAPVSLFLPSPQLQAPLCTYQLELPLSLRKQSQASEKLMSPP